MNWRRTGTTVGATMVLALGLGLVSAPAEEAHHGPGGHGHGRVVVGGGFYSPYLGPYFGFGFGPYAFRPWRWGWGGPWGYYGPEDHIDALTIAKMTGWGAIDLNVKPNRADVWVDGKYQAEARDLDGDPSYLWLEKGPHHLTIYKGGYKTFSEDVEVERGVLKDLKVRLERGNSVPPGEKPSSKQKAQAAGQSGQAD